MVRKLKAKKGFTLAELLIVVAIVAVLSAIAVPLFVSALNNAESTTVTANEKAVKSAAFNYILTLDRSDTTEYNKFYNTDGTIKSKTWYVEAVVNNVGEIESLKFSEDEFMDGAVACVSKRHEEDNGYDIYVSIEV